MTKKGRYSADVRSSNHYLTLTVPWRASNSAIREVYLGLARRHHPDRGGSTEKMSTLNEAWAVLKDDRRRKMYDRELMTLGVVVCARCEGKGVTVSRIGKTIASQCVECSGTGFGK